MRSGPRFALSLLLFAAFAVGCDTTTDDPPEPDGDSSGADDTTGSDSTTGSGSDSGLTWYATCGDPVCRGTVDPPPDDLCDDQTEGEACGERDTSCARNDGCNTRLLCTDADPTANGCPISRRAAKQEIHYLSDAELALLDRQLRDLRLATYRYRDGSAQAMARLGFIIDDLPKASYAVRPRGDRVDLYGYATMAVAAVKVQTKRIEELEQRLQQLERTCAAPR